jgi:hypothetical protein
VEMGGQIVETTGNRQMELAFESFCVKGTKNENWRTFSFFVPPTQKVSNAGSF